MPTTEHEAGDDQLPTPLPAGGPTHMQQPLPSDLDGEAIDDIEELARENALRDSAIRAPR